MISLLKIIMIAVYEMLPTSPFPSMFDSAAVDSSFLAVLNWFLPFDTCAEMMLTWLDCVMLYYVFVIAKKLLFDVILSNVISAGGGSFWSWWRRNGTS